MKPYTGYEKITNDEMVYINQYVDKQKNIIKIIK